MHKYYVDHVLNFTDEKYFIEFFCSWKKILPNLSTLQEREKKNGLAFLDIMMTRCPLRTIKKQFTVMQPGVGVHSVPQLCIGDQ